MNLNVKNKLFCIVILLFMSDLLCAQRTGGFELDGGIVSSSLDDDIYFYIGTKYSVWFNPYIALNLGGIFSHSKIDLSFTPPRDELVVYDIDDNIINFTGIAGVKFSSPTLGRLGLTTDFNFLFEPIPFNTVSVDKNIFDINSNLIEEKSKNKMIFTKFNPSYSIELGLFYELKKGKKRMRLTLGAGITSLNSYNTYYQAEIDGIKLKNHLKLKSDEISKMIFIRLSGI